MAGVRLRARPAWARSARSIAFDKRGTGLSDPVDTGRLPDLEDWMDDVRAVLDDVGVERADVMGIGAGAAMVLLFAAAHPHASRPARRSSTRYARLRRDDDYPAGYPPALVERILARSYIEAADASVLSGRDRPPPRSTSGGSAISAMPSALAWRRRCGR